jgi:glycosyltransferase involved in cell wall biosynthesis
MAKIKKGYKRMDSVNNTIAKLVMTLLVRNEEDIVRYNIDFHLSKGVDFIIATDNGSTDSTRDILREYEEKGVLHLIDEKNHNHNQAEWNNRMAGIARSQYGADIIFHCDADEFWYPRSGKLKDEISNRPEDILVVDVVNVLLEDKGGEEAFPEDTKFAVVNPVVSMDYQKESRMTNMFYFKYPSKVIFTPRKKVLLVSQGNHTVTNKDDSITEGKSQDIVIYHYPIRSKAHFFQKTIFGGSAYENSDIHSKDTGFHTRRWYASYKEGLLDEEYKKLILHKGDVDKLMTEGFIEEVDFNNVILGHENKDNRWRYFNRKFEYEDMFHDFNWPWAGHKRFAYDLVRNNMPQTIVELGTHKGTSFFSFCQAVKDAHYDAQLYAIDTWKGDEHAGFYGDDVFVEFQEMKEKYYGSLKIKLLRKTFDEAAADFKNDAIDLLHIDGLHTYEAVKHDFESWFPKVRKDGIILLHDIFITRDNFGIYKLWEELKRKYETIEFYHSYGLGVLFKNATRYRSFIDKERQWQIRYSYIAEDKKNGEIGNSLANFGDSLSSRDNQIVDLNRSLVENAEQITELNQAVAERDVSVANLIAERAHILSSTSWKITRPLRFIRSNFINNPYFLFRKLISDSVRKIWITLPLSAHRKISLKNNAFKYLPFLFRWTKAYRDWVAMTGNAVIAERDGQITSLRHALDERDEQIAGFNEALSERDAAAALVNRMENSFSWRLTRPLRFIARVYRQWLRADRQRLIKFARRMYHRMPLPFKFKVWLKAVYLKQQTMMDQNTVGSLIQDWNPLLGMAEIAGQYDPSHPWFLVVDLFFPSPDKDSGSVRMSGILSLLREQGFLLTFAADSGEEQNRYRQELQKQGIETLQGYSAIIEHLGQHGGKYRYVVLSRPDIAFRYLPAVRAFALNSEVVYDTVDLHWVRMEREMEISGDYNLKEQVTYYHRIELLNAACSDMVLAITPEEKARLLEEQPDTRVEILPNIHDPLPLVTPFDQRKGLMFIGGFWHKPNEDAVHYFVDQILPLVITAIPDIVFYIIGSNMPLSIKSLCSKHVEPLGYIADVQPYFSSCRVFVAPLRYGAGMKGKIGQSIAYGLPVVTTTIGAEGMGLVDGQHMLLADTPGAFADAVSRLYFESDLWHRLSANALGHLQKHYSMAATQRRLDAIFPLPEAVRGINAA